MSKNSKRAIINWAQFRFSVIGGLLARPPKSGQLQKELQVLAGREYLHPTTGEWVKFGTSTIERWYYQALKTQNPVDALARKIRSDAGQPIAMSQKLLAILQKQYENYPNWSYQLHADKPGRDHKTTAGIGGISLLFYHSKTHEREGMV